MSTEFWLLLPQALPHDDFGGVKNDISHGAPEEIRTPDPQIRSLVLYPAELRARLAHSRGKCSRAGQIRRERVCSYRLRRPMASSVIPGRGRSPRARESLITDRGYGFRVPSLRSGPGMTAGR